MLKDEQQVLSIMYASITQMLSYFNWPILSRSRDEQKATKVYIYIQDCESDTRLTDYLLIPNPDICHTRVKDLFYQR